jgi:hypothetical protein
MSGHKSVGFNSKMIHVVLPLLALASLAGSAPLPSIDRRNLGVIGLTLFKDEVHDAEDKLGPAVVFHSPGDPFAKRCYASTEKNGTVLILEDWAGTLVGFQILPAAPPGFQKCTVTPIVTPQISTEGGLKLGLTEKEVLKLLGPPTKRTKDTFVYHEDVQSSRKGSEGLFEYTDLEIKLINAKVVSIHVVHTLRD